MMSRDAGRPGPAVADQPMTAASTVPVMTPEQARQIRETQAIRLLRDGASLRQIMDATQLAEPDIRRLAADYPAARPAAPRPATAQVAKQPTPTVQPPQPLRETAANPDMPHSKSEIADPPEGLEALIARALGSRHAKVRNAARKVSKAVENLRDVLDDVASLDVEWEAKQKLKEQICAAYEAKASELVEIAQQAKEAGVSVDWRALGVAKHVRRAPKAHPAPTEFTKPIEDAEPDEVIGHDKLGRPITRAGYERRVANAEKARVALAAKRAAGAAVTG